MSTISNEVCLPRASTHKPVRSSLKPLAGLLVLALLMALMPARADEVEDAYVQILYVIKQGDELSASAKAAPAKAKYQEALTALAAFQKANPDWNPKMVTSRVKSVLDKMAAVAEAAAAPAAGGGTTNASASTAAAPSSARTIKLLDPGAEPRKELRLHPAPEDTQTLTMTVKMGSQTPGKGMPPLKLTLESSVKQVAENGTITYALVWKDFGMEEQPGTSPAAATAMKAAFATVKGLTGTGTLSSQGVSEELKVQTSAGSPAQSLGVAGMMQDMVAQLIVPFPAEPIGVGAKWQVKGPVKSQGMTVDQTVNYELVSLEGERLTVKDSTVENAAAQKIQNPAMPGVKVEVTRMTGRSTGERTVELTHVLPVGGTGKSHTETAGTMDMNGRKGTMNEKTDAQFQLEAK
jgi:Family of unknown function (DUF6263)